MLVLGVLFWGVIPVSIQHYRPLGVVDSVERFQYSQAVRVGDLLFVSGQAGWDANGKVPESYEDECTLAFENLRVVLAAAGCVFEHVVDATSLHTPGTDMRTFWRIRNDFFDAPWPAWTSIGDIGLVLPAMHVEVKVTAVIP